MWVKGDTRLGIFLPDGQNGMGCTGIVCGISGVVKTANYLSLQNDLLVALTFIRILTELLPPVSTLLPRMMVSHYRILFPIMRSTMKPTRKTIQMVLMRTGV